MAGPYGPVVDGAFMREDDAILPDTPRNLRRDGKFMKMSILAGVTKDEGSYFVGVYIYVFVICRTSDFMELIRGRGGRIMMAMKPMMASYAVLKLTQC